MVPATAGFLSALIIFGIAMVYFVAPSTLRADNDVPLVMVNTAPELQQSAFGMTLDTIDADSLVIEAYVDANGRVQDYRILSDHGKVEGSVAASQADADLHDVPSGAVDGASDVEPGSAVVLEDQCAGVGFPAFGFRRQNNLYLSFQNPHFSRQTREMGHPLSRFDQMLVS